MKNTFLNRVSAERKVLKIVNTLFSGNLQLAGLSQAALLRWESAVGKNRVANVLPLLTDLAEHCQRFVIGRDESLVASLSSHLGLAKSKWLPKMRSK